MVFITSGANGNSFDVTVSNIRNAKPSVQIMKCPSSICFGLDGSRGLSKEQFILQKTFLIAILRRLSRHTEMSSLSLVSYSSIVETIVSLSSNYWDAVNAVSAIEYNPDDLSFLGGGIVSCDAKLRDTAGQSKIVLFSSGLDNLGGDAKKRAEVFRDRAEGEIFVISIGGNNKGTLKEIPNHRNDFLELKPKWKFSEVFQVVNFLCS